MMPRAIIPFTAPDLSALAKSLRRELATRETPPSHVELLNMLARAAGHRNFQHLRAGADRHRVEAPESPAMDVALPAAEDEAVRRALRFFDAAGRFTSWPARTNLQHLCLWPVWARIPAGRDLTECEISLHLDRLHSFGDAAILRRTLWALGRVSRTLDGRVYRRIEMAPPPQALRLIRQLPNPLVPAGL